MVEFLKELFGDGTLNFEQFEQAIQEAGKDKFNVVNLAEGNYVSKSKYENELADKERQVKALEEDKKTRDKDLKDLKKQLEKAGTDENALNDLKEQLDTLKSNYDEVQKQYEQNLQKIKNESAAKEEASNYEFTSPAAKRDFINFILSKSFELDEQGKITGREELVAEYKKENEASFVVEKPAESKPQNTQPAPKIIDREQTPPPQHKMTLTEEMQLANQKQN